MDGTPRQVVEELQAAKVLRAVHSSRQLDEVLVDFWLNHFNVYANKGPLKFLVGGIRARRHPAARVGTVRGPAARDRQEPRDAVLPRQLPLGRTRARRRRRPSARGQGRRRGLNENYAREIMELHTLGVDGGYTQADVTEVARCFTGWTIRDLRRGDPEFVFDARVHDRGDKTVLGQRIEGGGREEGERVIHLLATHPATARFVSHKLARRFVADEPPTSLVDRAAETFRRTDGDIREVVEAIVTSPEFAAPAARRAKVKTPLEFVVSAARASGSSVVDARVLAKRIGDMGMPLYLQQPPTGYKDTADAWVSTSGLLARMNFAVDLASGRVSGAPVDVAALGTTAEAPVAAARLPRVPEEMSMHPSRRLFLKSSGLALVSFGLAPRALVRTVHAAVGSGRRKTLVVVFQRGACDGLNTVIPYDDDLYRRLRPTIAVPAPRGGGLDAALDLDGRFGLHPALAPLLPLWKEGILAPVHAIGSPDATRSHFDAQDFMESGTPGRKSTDDGWLNRHLLAHRQAEASPFRGVSLTPTLPRSLQGRAPAVAMASLGSFQVRGGTEGAAARGFEDLYDEAARTRSAPPARRRSRPCSS